eukprot:UN26835
MAKNHHIQRPLITILDLTWVAQSHHGCRSDTQFPALAHRLLGRQSHHENELNQEERDCENPIDISVGVVERRTGEADRIAARICTELHIEGIIPRIEDSEVVVGRDPRSPSQ